MDTDSVFVPPERAQGVVDFFQSLLNPIALIFYCLNPRKKISGFMELPLKGIPCTISKKGRSALWKMKGLTSFTDLGI